MTEYSNALAYLYGLEKLGIVFGLKNIQWILHHIGNPHNLLKTIHIGGTNGKGSVAAMLSSAYKAAGYKVGTYTSPHLVSFTERITINEEQINENEVAELTAYLRDAIERADHDRIFTFFDFTTALAFEYFRRHKVDLAVVEVGLGGRLDSTNVVNPLVSVITNVAMDHMDYLGDDTTRIAREKAGIIKKGVPVVTGADSYPAQIIEKTARLKGSPIYMLGRDFSYEKTNDQHMSYSGRSIKVDDIFVNLRGDHQLANAAVAACVVEVLASRGFAMNQESLIKGFSEVRWPGRLEIVKEKPLIILDGAHNTHGIRALIHFLEAQFPGRRKVLIFAAMKDKEWEKMLIELIPHAHEIIATKVDSDRALAPDAVKGLVPAAHVAPNPAEAMRIARSRSTVNDVIIVTGSLYLIGECAPVINDIF